MVTNIRSAGRFCSWQLCSLSLVFVMLASACAPRPELAITADSIVVFPPPPDSTRIQFLTRISSSNDVSSPRSGFFALFSEPPKSVSILKPYGIASSPGRIYVSDITAKAVQVIDLEKGTWQEFRPSGLGALQAPVNAAVDENGWLYVADRDRGQVVVFDSDLKYRTSIGDADTLIPVDVALRDGKVWVVDFEGHAVRVFSKVSNELVYSIPTNDADTLSWLYSPTNLAVDDKYVYVSDMGDSRIKVYTTDGDFVSTFGGMGTGPGRFVRPKGVAVDRNGILFAVDAAFENVQMFNQAGQVLMFFGGPYRGPGDMWLPATVAVDYDNLDYFRKFVYEKFELEYLIFVTNQFGPDKIGVYGFVGPKPTRSTEL